MPKNNIEIDRIPDLLLTNNEYAVRVHLYDIIAGNKTQEFVALKLEKPESHVQCDTIKEGMWKNKEEPTHISAELLTRFIEAKLIVINDGAMNFPKLRKFHEDFDFDLEPFIGKEYKKKEPEYKPRYPKEEELPKPASRAK